eukprot:CAMPEP_0206275882 /NCGR_PEP_ID=MMETSP0047_2-20121206/36001_1 /ASSEMBLY_ACC=CAM_ASM_000192 /TAXON_ID=195065 /ORGANISM="Chroomonas mesostigmatica_cf, Strain CCMP1168" /LENGTH=66 /DNA_ID=CAMNT_0053705345 /DNA_START=12 /DNA_END=209 /DNA_ORIENTATION=-
MTLDTSCALVRRSLRSTRSTSFLNTSNAGTGVVAGRVFTNAMRGATQLGSRMLLSTRRQDRVAAAQ